MRKRHCVFLDSLCLFPHPTRREPFSHKYYTMVRMKLQYEDMAKDMVKVG